MDEPRTAELAARIDEIVAEYWTDATSENEDAALRRLAKALAKTEAAVSRPAVRDGLREALRAVLRDYEAEPTEEYLTEAVRIFLAALADKGSPAVQDGLREALRRLDAPMDWDRDSPEERLTCFVDEVRALADKGSRQSPDGSPTDEEQERWAVRDGLQEALIPLASRMADHLFHPEDHDPKDECWIDLYRTIVGMDGPLADKGSREAGELDVERLARAIAASEDGFDFGGSADLDANREHYGSARELAAEIARHYSTGSPEAGEA